MNKKELTGNDRYYKYFDLILGDVKHVSEEVYKNVMTTLRELKSKLPQMKQLLTNTDGELS